MLLPRRFFAVDVRRGQRESFATSHLIHHYSGFKAR